LPELLTDVLKRHIEMKRDIEIDEIDETPK